MAGLVHIVVSKVESRSAAILLIYESCYSCICHMLLNTACAKVQKSTGSIIGANCRALIIVQRSQSEFVGMYRRSGKFRCNKNFAVETNRENLTRE